MADLTGLDSELIKKMGSSLFNKAWDYIDKERRTNDETITMLTTAHASYWFWDQYKGKTDTNVSIGLWQLARVYALAGCGELAILFGEKCVEISKEKSVDSFYLAYGYESAARGYKLKGEKEKVLDCLDKAYDALKTTKEKELDAIKKNLEELRQ